MTPVLRPLGDRAILAEYTDFESAIGFASALAHRSFPWVEDVVPAYSRVGVHIDPDRIGLRQAMAILGEIVSDPTVPCGTELHIIPVCYDGGPDLDRVAAFTGLSFERIVALHASIEYTVFAIGFVPGFPYLGELPEPLRGVPRLDSPRVRVEPGSVGLTGSQTGIYPLARPGGWNLIGRTPLTIVDPATDFFPIRVGDRVQFEPIDRSQFDEDSLQRLARRSAAW